MILKKSCSFFKNILKKNRAYDIIFKITNIGLIKSGGETGSVKPRQPALRKVLIPEDEKKVTSPALAGDFLKLRSLYEKSIIYIRIGNRRTSR